jgi:hypothetical protein
MKNIFLISPTILNESISFFENNKKIQVLDEADDLIFTVISSQAWSELNEKVLAKSIFYNELHEGVKLQILTEAAVGDFFSKIGEFFRKVWEATKQFFSNVWMKIQQIFLTKKAFVEKYKDIIIEGARNLAFNKTQAVIIKNAEKHYQELDEAIKKLKEFSQGKLNQVMSEVEKEIKADKPNSEFTKRLEAELEGNISIAFNLCTLLVAGIQRDIETDVVTTNYVNIAMNFIININSYIAFVNDFFKTEEDSYKTAINVIQDILKNLKNLERYKQQDNNQNSNNEVHQNSSNIYNLLKRNKNQLLYTLNEEDNSETDSKNNQNNNENKTQNNQVKQNQDNKISEMTRYIKSIMTLVKAYLDKIRTMKNKIISALNKLSSKFFEIIKLCTKYGKRKVSQAFKKKEFQSNTYPNS